MGGQQNEGRALKWQVSDGTGALAHRVAFPQQDSQCITCIICSNPSYRA